jgi:hypothetical protein
VATGIPPGWVYEELAIVDGASYHARDYRADAQTLVPPNSCAGIARITWCTAGNVRTDTRCANAPGAVTDRTPRPSRRKSLATYSEILWA